MNTFGRKSNKLPLLIVLLNTVYGCLYTELVSIGHSGSLTDYGTDDDEINMGVMVGNWFTFAYI